MGSMKDAAYWIDKLQMEKHPEGGYYRETYRSEESLREDCLPDRFPGERTLATAIYFLLPGDEISALHRIRSDEIWHFYTGSSLSIYRIDEVGNLSRIILGNDYERGEVFQAVVRAGCWFGAMVDVRGSFSLVGCTVAPGFDYSDFEMGRREELIDAYPQHRSIIERLSG
jgi:predicted cupin superfamily sugar epimerase